MRTGHTTRIRWGLDLVEIPPLRTSQNGWYYDFDGSTLGRGSDGLQAAEKTIRERRLAVLADHDFKTPDEVWPQHTVGYHYSGLVAWTDDPVFGQVGVAFSPESDKDRHRLTLDVHPLLYELVNQTPHTNRDTTTIAGSPHLIVPRLWDHAREIFPMLERVKTPEIDLKWAKGELEQEDGSHTKSIDDASFFQTMSPDALDEAASKRIEALISLFNVLGHHDVRVQTQYVPNPAGYGHKRVTTGIDVVVKDPEHEESHRITIKSTGQASVTCGFRESEQKYLEYQKRQLAGWMQGELGDDAEFEEITFD